MTSETQTPRQKNPLSRGRKKPPPRPDLIKIGPSVILVSKSSLARQWDISPKRLLLLLGRLRIPTLRIGMDTYFNLTALESVLYVLLRPGSTGLVAKGPDTLGNAVRALPEGILARLQDSLDPIHGEIALVSLRTNASDVKAIRAKMTHLAQNSEGRKGKPGDRRYGRRIPGQPPPGRGPAPPPEEPNPKEKP